MSDEKAKDFARRRKAIFLRRDTFAARQEIAVSSLMRAEHGALSERGYTKAFAALAHEEARFAILSPAQRRFAQAVYETGLSQAKAARRCGVSQARISKWLRGEEEIQSETLSLVLGRLCGEAPPAEQEGEDDGEGKKTTKGQIQQIKERRLALGWTCEDLAREAIVPAESIERAEKGKKRLPAEKYGLIVAALNAEERSRAQFVVHDGKVLKVGGFEEIRAGDQLCGKGGVRATVLQVIDSHSIRVLVDRGTGAHTAIWSSKPVDGWAGQVVTRDQEEYHSS